MRRTIQLTPEQLSCIHDKTVEILEIAGVDLRHKGASELMKKKGFKIEGTRLCISEKQLMEAVDSTLDRFTLKSVTSDKQVRIGGNDFIITSTSGATSVIDDQGRRRNATLSDYIDFLDSMIWQRILKEKNVRELRCSDYRIGDSWSINRF